MKKKVGSVIIKDHAVHESQIEFLEAKMEKEERLNEMLEILTRAINNTSESMGKLSEAFRKAAFGAGELAGSLVKILPEEDAPVD